MRDSEFWIFSDGNVESANSNVDDNSHESIALETLRRSIVDKAENTFNILNRKNRSFLDQYYIDWDEFLYCFGELIGNKLIRKCKDPQKREEYKELLYDNASEFSEQGFRLLKIDQETINVAMEQGGTDVREYAIKKWKWKAYRDGYIESWRLAKSDLNTILTGLYNISEILGWSERAYNRKIFNLYSYESKKRYALRISQIEKFYNQPKSIKNQDDEIQYKILKNQANKQIRQMDIDNLHSFYKKDRGGSFNGGGVINQLGDSILSFRDYLQD